MNDAGSALMAAISDVSKRLEQASVRLKNLSKALGRLDTSKSLERQDYVADAVGVLKSSGADVLDFVGAGGLVAPLADKLASLQADAHHTLLTGLAARLGEEKASGLKILSDLPLVLFISPLTLEVDLGQSRSVLSYAREPLLSMSLDPDEIIRKRAEWVDFFRASRVDSVSFWDICLKAYRMVLLKDGIPEGGRVDIVELLQPLSWLWPNQTLFKKNALFPKYLLAYQLQKLRSDRLLAHDGLRIDLGTATAGTTRNKANVIFIPTGGGEGQYYLSICFRKA